VEASEKLKQRGIETLGLEGNKIGRAKHDRLDAIRVEVAGWLFNRERS